ncbi:MAG: glycosyltransferase family 9 protein [Verrucomicrobiae bacterium]|nr:glycosyltransferase family 9 protein [Verrucomicrobiae bacterium]
MKRSLIRFLIRLLRTFCRPSRPLSARGLRLTVLVPGYAGLGNFIMMTPLFAAIKREFPGSRVILVAGNPWGAEHVLAGSGLVDRTVIVPENAALGRRLLAFARLRAERPDVVFLPCNASPPFVWLGALLAGAPVRVGHTLDALGRDMSWTRAVLTHEVSLRLGIHETDFGLDLLDALAGHSVSREGLAPRIASAPSEATLEKFGLAPRGYLVLQVSAANAQATPKRWPIENFARLAERLHADGERLVLLGDRDDRAITNQFLAVCPAPVTDLTGRTSIPEAAALLAAAKALVCHDSGLMHIGDAVGAPLVALFGPTDLAVTGPRAPTSRVVRRETLPCIGCMKNFGKTEAEALRDCRRELECMRSISIEQVLAAVRELLPPAA